MFLTQLVGTLHDNEKVIKPIYHATEKKIEFYVLNTLIGMPTIRADEKM